MAEEEKKDAFDVNKAVDEVKKDRNLMLTVGGAALVIISVFLPWYEVGFGGFSVSTSPGLNSTGLFLVILSVVAAGAALNVLKQDAKQMRVVAIVAGALALLVVFSNWPDSELGSLVTISLGYWAALVGSVATVAGGVMKYMGANKK